MSTSEIGSVAGYRDGSTAEFDLDGILARQTRPDGVVLDAFDAHQRPTAGHTDAARFTVAYPEARNDLPQERDGAGVELSPAGDVIRRRYADGTVHESFDSLGRPHQGIAGDTRFDIEYGANGRVTNRFVDGTVVDYDGAGRVLRHETPDGTVYDSFDPAGRPTAGHGTTDFTIDYPAGGGSVIRYADGSSATFDADGTLVSQSPGPAPDPGTTVTTAAAEPPARQVADDGTVFSSFDGDGRPLAGETPEGDRFTMSYDAGGGSTVSYADGSTVVFDAAGDVVSQRLADGTVFSSFDGENRPLKGETPEGDRFTMSYDAASGSTMSYGDGSSVGLDADGKVISQRLADGTAFTSFDGDGRPLTGRTPEGERFTISYDAGGGSTMSYADGSSVVFDAAGEVTRQTLADGTVFTSFDGEGRPLSGVTPEGDPFTISYDDGGGSTMTYPDGSSVVFGADGAVTRQTLDDGTVFTAFDDDGRPVAGETPEDDPFTVAYDERGSRTSYADGSSVRFDANGTVVSQRLADGTEFTRFDAQGRPLAGTTPEGQRFAVSYDDRGGSVMTYADGSSVSFAANGAVVSQTLADGTEFTGFDPENRPLAGRTPEGQQFAVSYDDRGGSVTRYADGSSVTVDANGTVVGQRLADGTVFTAFDGEGRPWKGMTPEGRSITLTYDGGTVTTAYGDGSSLTTDADGDPLRMTTVDGTVFTEFHGDGRPKVGVTAQGERFTMTYDDTDHTTRIAYDNGTTIVLDANDDPTYMSTSDGSVFTDFLDDGRPRSGTGPNGEHISFTYDDRAGTSTAVIGDNTIVYDAGGNPVSLTTAQGYVFSDFENGNFTRGYDPASGRHFDISYGPNGETTWRYGEHDSVTFDRNGRPIYAEYVDGDGRAIGVDYAIQIPLLQQTAEYTRTERETVSAQLELLKGQITEAKGYWVSPAGRTFEAYSAVVETAANNLLGVLDAAISKLELTHANYVGSESTNAGNMTPK
ncbi:hypothetical protein [Catenuloplanes atrovinosus]|uniref:YD repeat-containing protein n=1 Tax=Catenuloplanes atrovinosus TaxID=137266 RepID=A0AAE3YIB4_9ACTN|nr:hypothetical protein [Catenuloplanes atrovinosus]MDR7274219.1 YD repeat-containing protein [Catenuloplanes atrovinosus]